MPKKQTVKRRKPVKKTHKRRINRRTVGIIGSLVVIAILLGTLYYLLNPTGNESSLPLNAIGSFVTPIQNAVTRMTDGIRSFIVERKDYSALQEENKQLERENTQLTLQLNDATELINTYQRLSSLEEALDTYDSLNPVIARVSAHAAGQWFNTFSINKGTADGLTTGMAVVNADGLIGHIYEIGLNYAKVLCIIDSRSGLGCLIQRTRDNGIMRGGVTGTADKAECSVYYLPNINNIIPGDVVITSGTDSLYPKGLIIGTVSEISLSAGSEGSFAVVTPAVDFLHLEEVLVLRTVVEDTDEQKAPLLTPTPGPSASPSPTPDPQASPTIDPAVGEANFAYPSAQTGDQPVNDVIEMLPEDKWAD